MKKISTVATERIQIFKENQLTIGLDLGDRSSHYCILNEAGDVILEAEATDDTERNRAKFSARFRAAGSRWKPERIHRGSAGS